MAALLQDTNYRLSQAENQRILDRDKMAAEARAMARALEKKSQEEMARLNEALKDAQAALDQKIQETAPLPVDAGWRAQIEKLKTAQEALQQQVAGTAGTAGVAGAAGTAGAAGAAGAEGSAAAAAEVRANDGGYVLTDSCWFSFDKTGELD